MDEVNNNAPRIFDNLPILFLLHLNEHSEHFRTNPNRVLPKCYSTETEKLQTSLVEQRAAVQDVIRR